jgi:imidazolonepropionase
MSKGTGAIEIKSGYGLSTADEIKMLRVIRRIRDSVPAIVRATFLGAHAVPRGMSQEAYVNQICDEMIPAVAAEGLADFVDVFCDEGFFTPAETMRIAEKGAEYGMRPKLHANELAISGGVQAGVKCGALSVDHLERTSGEEIQALLSGGCATIPTFLPGSSFFLGLPFGNARGFIAAGLPVALASDWNPGSSPSGDMRFVMALGCIRLKLTPTEALIATTLNSAYAMGCGDIAGSVTPGKAANLIITVPLPSLTMIPYQYNSPFISKVILGGRSEF